MTAGLRVAVGVDVGGTKVNAVRALGDGTVQARETRVTPAGDLDAIVATLVEAGRSVMSDDVAAIGVGAAGMVDLAGALHSAPNLAWEGVPLERIVNDTFGLPARVDNDCNAAGYAEWRSGAARGHDDVLYVGVGTGIGGGIVSGGRVVRGARGFAGEIGHVMVEPSGLECGCGNRGCWETVASGTAILRDGRRAVTRHAHSLLAGMTDGDPERVTGAMVSEAAAKGDPAATGILAEVGHRLGVGIAGLVNVLDPSIVVIGGGAASAGEPLLEPARTAYVMTVEGRADRPEVPLVAAALGPDGAAIGAALLALEEAG